MRAPAQLGVWLALPMLVLGSAAPAQASPPPGCRRMPAACCLPGEEPCVRPGPARVLLLSLGALAGAGSAAILFALGDRLAQGDPATVLVGTGAVAGAGALLGMLAGRTLGDGPALEDRVRRETLGVSLGGGGTRVADEREPPTMALRFAPTWWFDGGRSRVRLLGDVGGRLGAERHTDPRPQSSQQGARPVTLEQRRLAFGLGLDLAVAMPYPATRRSARLGRAELRYRPEVQYRREWVELGEQGTRVVERTMLLPLLVGARWHLSPRQRFTVYVGPRFDVVSYSDPGGRKLARGRPQIAPLYAEAWYDLDIPLTEHARRDGAARRARTSGMFSLGYVHSRFDGRGFNFGPVIGFLGPVHVDWTLRIRPRGAKAAAQAGVGVAIGNGVSTMATLGVVLPEIHGRPRR